MQVIVPGQLVREHLVASNRRFHTATSISTQSAPSWVARELYGVVHIGGGMDSSCKSGCGGDKSGDGNKLGGGNGGEDGACVNGDVVEDSNGVEDSDG